MTNNEPWYRGLTAPDGRQLTLVGEIDDAQATELLSDGAELAVDECGDNCAGTAWLEPAVRKAVLKRGLIRKRRGQGSFLRFDSAEGSSTVLLSGGDLRR